MFTALVMGVGAAVLVLIIEAVQVARGHGLAWDPWVRDKAAEMHARGTLLAVLISYALLGVSAALSAWPVFIGAWLSRKLAHLGMDALHPTPRVIEHADGRQALVDARTGQGYQRVPADVKPDAVTAWLRERM